MSAFMSSNQDSSNAEALQALLQSFGPDAAQNVSQEALQRLSDKLSELMGTDVVRDAFAYNDQGGQLPSTSNEMLVNEEGLPIIDISESEPAHDQSQIQPRSSIDPTFTLDAPSIIELSTLSDSERDLRKRERERILDLLEAEEVLEQRRGREKEVRERKEALDRKREDGRSERERLLELKETHKKMGKALLRSVVPSDDIEKKQESIQPSSSAENGAAFTPNIKKKSVSFAPDVAAEAEAVELTPKPSMNIADWGDVSAGRLRTNLKPFTPDIYARQSEQLMKLQVVERVPGSDNTPSPSITVEAKDQSSTSRIQILDASAGDSDDESDLDSASLSDDENVPQDSDTEHSDAGLGNSDLDEETDWDFAQHQREIALEYHKKRDKIGKDTAAALTSHTHEPDEDPLDVELSLDRRKATASLSRFRADHLASSYAAANTNAMPSSSSHSPRSSALPTMIPAGVAQTLQHAVRLGKLDEQERLVGGEAGDSGSEPDDDIARGILELLQKGEAYNLGPNGETIYAVRPNASENSTDRPTKRSDRLPPFTPPTEPLPQKSKNSRFKLATRTERLSSPSASLESSGTSTPVSNAGRSSPKSAMESSVVERTVFSTSTLKQSNSSSAASANDISPPLSSNNTMIVESPSFPQSATSLRRPERPPTIMSSHVVESSPRRTDGAKTEEAPKRVSRFKAERM
ncbi:hypothetical protein J3R30DRAFT_3430316 [Lentinula aciculospora]|uniref:DUF3835 domain-containing protein n=1 Tax=Lentinula aciculospora TaxID=153920 RepID=A0A9W9ARZ1_9AGAR|nr:hypothetical protein J3R30DRAFT_3430316 [Lentinula aciculospora]